MLNRMARAMMRPFDERFDAAERIKESLLNRSVPEYATRYYYCFGGIAFFLFLIQVITGALLTLYYVPSVDQAYSSTFYISNYVNYGWLIRSVHSWSAQLMFVFVVLHMIRVYVTASYKHPRELNWVAGVVLLIATMASLLTGNLLPWDQKAYWGSTVVVSLAEKIPIMGKPLSHVIMGGDKIGQATLTRFFSAHIMLLPAGLIVFMAVHFWMVRKQGISEPL